MGRTETIHPGSAWSVEWTKCMDDPLMSHEEKKTLLKKAIRHQTQFRLEATIGKGCDRHLLGLLCASRELGMDLPKIFRDDVRSFIRSLSLSSLFFCFRSDTVGETLIILKAIQSIYWSQNVCDNMIGYNI